MITVKDLSFSYKEQKALKNVSFEIAQGETFGLLGPNGSGKTTLFRILSTAIDFSEGAVQIGEHDLKTHLSEVRRQTGIVFQSPSLDGKLSVHENMVAQGRLYGMSGSKLSGRVDEMLQRLGLSDRRKHRVDKLSGGLKRRVELAKGLLHKPKLLILDEPSTGLDPGARGDLWRYLKTLRSEEGVTILVTTHLMEEAEECDRIAILNQGELVAIDKPDSLKNQVSAEVLVMESDDTESLAQKIKTKYINLQVQIKEAAVYLEFSGNHAFIAELMDQYKDEIKSMTVRKPTLEDVFLHHTGHSFWQSKREASNV